MRKTKSGGELDQKVEQGGGGAAAAKIKCALCAHREHILTAHVLRKHNIQPEEYLERFPAAALWSSYGWSKIREHNQHSAARLIARPRRAEKLAKIFPDFGKASGREPKSSYPVFDTPGPLTPQLDPDYVFPEEQTLQLLAILEKPRRNRAWICGPSGCGKTCLVFNLAAKIGAEVMEWNADAFQQRSTLIGHWSVKDGETVWMPGILPRAMERGVWLVINEIDTIDPHTLNLLKPVLEDPPRLTVLEHDGEMVHAHPDFRVIAVANTWGRGDQSGLFVNTHTQSEADVRRWSARILLDYLPEEQEREILQRAIVDLEDADAQNFVSVATRVREAYKHHRIDKTFSPAELVNWAENFMVFGDSALAAARLSFLNALAPDVQAAIEEMIIAVFGDSR